MQGSEYPEQYIRRECFEYCLTMIASTHLTWLRQVKLRDVGESSNPLAGPPFLFKRCYVISLFGQNAEHVLKRVKDSILLFAIAAPRLNWKRSD